MSHKNTMKSPWDLFAYPQYSMGWRMGGGEDYLAEWHEWFTHLSHQEQQMYIDQHPEPEDWFYFYQLRLTRDDEEYSVLIEQMQRLRTHYCELHYTLADLHESAGHHEVALEHMGRVLSCIINYKIWDDGKANETIDRYSKMKRRLTRKMALNPDICKGWQALHQSTHRIRIPLERRSVTTEDYVRMQKKVFLPLDFGRTWTKCFENNMLYIHRHWREPCLFLVILEPVEHGYSIVEAWMNTSISGPLAKPPAPDKPEHLLTFLLGWFIKT